MSDFDKEALMLTIAREADRKLENHTPEGGFTTNTETPKKISGIARAIKNKAAAKINQWLVDERGGRRYGTFVSIDGSKAD